MSGYKRSHESSADRARDADRKPKDWRDAFLDDDQPRRRDRSRDDDNGRRRTDERGHRDDGRGDRHRGGLDYSDRDRRGAEERDSRGQYSHGSSRQYPTREQRGGAARGYERESDRRRHNEQPAQLRYDDKEEGEIESPPLQPQPTTSQASLEPITAPPQQSEPARGFRTINVPTQPRSSIAQVRSDANVLDQNGRESKRARVEQEAQVVEPVIVIEEERDPEKVLEDRRKKREEIMAKFRANGGKAAMPSMAVEGKEAAGAGADSVTSAGMRTAQSTSGATPLLKVLGTRSAIGSAATPISTTPALREPSLASTPLGNDFDLSKQNPRSTPATADDLISAADYDPTAEGAVDQARRDRDTQIGEKAKQVAEGVGEPIVVPDDEWEEVEMEVDDEDEEVDMFSAFEDSDRPKKKRKVKVRRRKQANGSDAPEIIEVIDNEKKKATVAVADNVDDAEGYFRITPGEVVDDGRYQMTTTLGKGMFSAVVKAKVLKAVGQERRQDVVGKEVAIKVIRSQESMYVAGRKEAQILKCLNDADPDDKKHIVRMEHTFEHHGHLCIVTESLSMNLRDVLKRFGKDVGLNMRAVRAYAHQMFLALSLMRKCSIVHADIKPDNILVSENKATLKVCDFGSASDVADGDITPYLVSRFYRAPEIILGLPFDTAIDIWSIGCTLYELYTGKILFPGRSNNHMLYLMMEVKGKINHRLIKKATFGEMYFDEGMNFLSVEKDKITGSDVLKTLVISGPSRDIRSRIMPSSSIQLKMKDDEIKQMASFVDLLDKCLQLDPAKRITPRDALLHPFVAGTA